MPMWRRQELVGSSGVASPGRVLVSDPRWGVMLNESMSQSRKKYVLVHVPSGLPVDFCDRLDEAEEIFSVLSPLPSEEIEKDISSAGAKEELRALFRAWSAKKTEHLGS